MTSFAVPTDDDRRTWLITGASRGLGRAFAVAALRRGDRVAATARRLDTVSDLQAEFGDAVLPLALDVTDRTAARRAVEQAIDHFGRLDVLVNNAGFALSGTVEDVTEADAREQLDTHLLGPLWTTQAALPHMRERGGGHIVQVTSIGGVTSFPLLGLYHASKWGLEGWTDSLAQEVAPFGIRVTMVEPGGFRTDASGASMRRGASSPAYAAPLAEEQERRSAALDEQQERGDPAKAAAALLAVVDAEDPPLRLLLGDDAMDLAVAAVEQRLAGWRAWEHLTRSVDVDLVPVADR